MFAMKEGLLDDDKNKKPLYPDPDVLQMIPFKPRQIYRKFLTLYFTSYTICFLFCILNICIALKKLPFIPVVMKM